jgi:hypothetical protein
VTEVALDVRAIGESYSTRTTMAKGKRKKITDEEVRGWFSPEFWESDERANRLLTERLGTTTARSKRSGAQAPTRS